MVPNITNENIEHRSNTEFFLYRDSKGQRSLTPHTPHPLTQIGGRDGDGDARTHITSKLFILDVDDCAAGSVCSSCAISRRVWWVDFGVMELMEWVVMRAAFFHRFLNS